MDGTEKTMNYREQARRDLNEWFTEHVGPTLRDLPDGTVIQIGDGLPVIVRTDNPPIGDFIAEQLYEEWEREHGDGA